jgi:acyl-CoA reductase-like NAD-dependent aldehyde dehydrogenase
MTTFQNKTDMDKAVSVLGKDTVLKILSMDAEEVEKLDEKVDELLESRREEKSAPVTKEYLKSLYEHFGYQIPDGSKFWKIGGLEKGRGQYGLQVGQYTHSCHIDTLEIIVLLVLDGNDNYVESYADLWLSDCIVV